MTAPVLLAVHGIPRATGDLDLLIALEPENASRLMVALADFGAPVESHGITARDFEGLHLPVLGRRQLLANKLASGRPKDLLDAQMLEHEPDDHGA